MVFYEGWIMSDVERRVCGCNEGSLKKGSVLGL